MKSHSKDQMVFVAVGMSLLALLPGCGKNTEFVGGDTGPSACIAEKAQSQGLSAFSDEGKLADNQDFSIRVSLALNNPEDLKEELHDLYDPLSPQFHHFLTPEEFRARYAPTPEQVSKVVGFLTSHGLHSIELEPVGYLLKAQGTPSAIGSAFMTELHQYQDVSGERFFAVTRPATLPATLPILTIAGLDNLKRLRPHIHLAPPTGLSSDAAPETTGSGPGGGLSPSDIQTAYNFPDSVNGSGQTLGLAEFDGYTASDITVYDTYFSLAAVPLTNVLVDGATGSAGSNADEVTLDIELMNAIAPGASGIRVYEAPNTFSGELDIYSTIISDNDVRAVSISWGSTEGNYTSGDLEAENIYFTEMAALGMSVFVASGDSGACSGSTLVVNDPASQPYVTAVGGTSLTLGSGRSYGSETSWNNLNDGEAYGGGGGMSSYWEISDETGSYQSGLGTVLNEGSSTYRMLPDVSLESDPYSNGYAIYFGEWSIFGGTSAASPIWAAYTALVNQERVANAKSVLGFANPAIYSIAQGINYSTDFHDIADGSNNLHYPAETGYDLTTGWGSLNGTNLYNDLIAY